MLWVENVTDKKRRVEEVRTVPLFDKWATCRLIRFGSKKPTTLAVGGIEPRSFFCLIISFKYLINLNIFTIFAL